MRIQENLGVAPIGDILKGTCFKWSGPVHRRRGIVSPCKLMAPQGKQEGRRGHGPCMKIVRINLNKRNLSKDLAQKDWNRETEFIELTAT